ncbi:carbon catabolite repressor protein 4 homolog 5 [Ipomoea triloba]|uniref:carbon catabolite repressor protein 4 homolog 5 n=1 Tax=Ipomoea triloba TaxID=35885 RepID=UPI00125E6809|nr:carbon catabolite repressor protein 4 homolog 5 [Ipomoea triloba]
MGRVTGGEMPPSKELAKHPTSSKRKTRRYNGDRREKRKKRRVTALQTEAHSETLSLEDNSNRTLTSHMHACAHANYHRSGEYRGKRKRQRPANTVDRRKWVYSPRDVSHCKDGFVFVSYNLLAVENAKKHPDLYPNVSPELMDWDYRKQILCKEVRGYNPGIMCFQEVDRYDDLDNLLQKDGFRGVYQPRTGDSCDGCAIFWKNELFTLLHKESIEFQRFGLRNNVAQFCVFKRKRKECSNDSNALTSEDISSQRFLVGNIHVLFNPKRGDIKLGQIRLLIENAQRLSREWGNIPIVLAGDLNSMPKSAVYQFLTSSKLDIRMHDRRHISGQIDPSVEPTYRFKSVHAARVRKPFMHRWTDEELRLATGTVSVHLLHQLKLCSAYAGVPGTSKTRDDLGEPLATSFHSQFLGTVDYIWHTAELVPLRVLDPLPVNILRRTRGLPSEEWGSDHLALVCELAFAGEGKET